MILEYCHGRDIREAKLLNLALNYLLVGSTVIYQRECVLFARCLTSAENVVGAVYACRPPSVFLPFPLPYRNAARLLDCLIGPSTTPNHQAITEPRRLSTPSITLTCFPVYRNRQKASKEPRLLGIHMIMEPINSEDDCIRELIRCRERFAKARVQSASDVNHQLSLYGFGSGRPHDLSNASPVPEIVRQFAREAAKALSKDEFSSLLVFLQDPKGHRKAPKEHLKQQLDARLKSFNDEEIQVSGLKKDRLARPGGPEDADLGIILHLQSEEDTIGPFWNEESATIDLLMRKGLGEKAVFGFDWHWRAEETFRGRSACPARSWPKALRTIHNNMSCEVLEILPLPFLVTASSCARDNLAAVLGPKSKRLHLTIKPPNGMLRLDLDFRSGNLRRIVFHVHHPAAGFFASNLSRPAMAAQIDAGLDLALWVTGKPSQPNLFAQEYALSRPRYSRRAPLADFYAYIRKEREEERILRLDEYEPAFLGWVRRYLGRDPTSILSTGVSVGASVVEQIGSKISAELRHRHRLGTSKAVTKTGHARPPLDSRPSSRLIGTGSDGANHKKPSQFLLKTNDGSSSYPNGCSHRREPMRAVTEPVGGSSSDGINEVEEIDMEEINDSVKTKQLEDIDHHGGANEEPDFLDEQEHCLKSLDHINTTACQVEIPEPMDDQLLEDMPSPYTGADVETSQEFIPDTFHGTEVIVQASGTV